MEVHTRTASTTAKSARPAVGGSGLVWKLTHGQDAGAIMVLKSDNSNSQELKTLNVSMKLIVWHEKFRFISGGKFDAKFRLPAGSVSLLGRVFHVFRNMCMYRVNI